MGVVAFRANPRVRALLHAVLEDMLAETADDQAHRARARAAPLAP